VQKGVSGLKKQISFINRELPSQIIKKHQYNITGIYINEIMRSSSVQINFLCEKIGLAVTTIGSSQYWKMLVTKIILGCNALTTVNSLLKFSSISKKLIEMAD